MGLLIWSPTPSTASRSSGSGSARINWLPMVPLRQALSILAVPRLALLGRREKDPTPCSHGKTPTAAMGSPIGKSMGWDISGPAAVLVASTRIRKDPTRAKPCTSFSWLTREREPAAHTVKTVLRPDQEEFLRSQELGKGLSLPFQSRLGEHLTVEQPGDASNDMYKIELSSYHTLFLET